VSVKICYKNGQKKDFSNESSVADQLKDVDYVHITVTDDYGKSAENFLKCVSEMSPFEIIPPVDLKVEKGDMIIGAKISKNAKNLGQNLALYWLVREIVSFQSRLDNKLNDIIKNIKT
jgi:hypothetical protein